MPGAELYPRQTASMLTEALTDSPAVLIHGPRQCGKTTLARMVAEPLGYRYFTFDEAVARHAAELDPAGFVADLPGPVILDEVQHVPALFAALKTAIDRDRKPGRFILTGSTNVLLLPRLSDSLAGRMEILRLHPLAQCELARAPSDFLDTLFDGGFGTGHWERMGAALAERIAAGGYPAALARANSRRRAAWYRDYLDTLVSRDVRELARVSALDALPRLLALAASQTARLLNVSELAAPFQLSRPTIRDYLTLLARVFLLEELPPWHSNRLSRLIKTPKLHLGDTGTACALLGVDAKALGADRQLLGQPRQPDQRHLLRRGHAEHGPQREPQRAEGPAGEGRPQGGGHHHPQVRRDLRGAEYPG
jgi:predicted AAA+ superfamily ATPase